MPMGLMFRTKSADKASGSSDVGNLVPKVPHELDEGTNETTDKERWRWSYLMHPDHSGTIYELIEVLKEAPRWHGCAQIGLCKFKED